MSGSGAMAQDRPFKSPAALLGPSSVAIVGASDRARWPKLIFEQLRAHGFPGPLYPVNPRASEIWGERCYPDLSSLPTPPDHAVVIVPAPAVLSVLEVGVANGLRSATIYASGIGEGSAPEAVERAAALRALIQRSGLAVVGPNCMGATAYRERYFGYATAEVCTVPFGPVAFVSQSGGTVRHVVCEGAERGLKFAYAISSGNEIDLDLADYVRFFVDNDDVKIIALFIEGLRRPARFIETAAMALAAGKPIIVLKSGRSTSAAQSAFSHTGAVAGDYDVFKAMCRRYGIVCCATLDEMIEVLLAFQAGRLPRGRRLAVVTTSGGTTELLHDYLEDTPGVVAPEFSPETTARIARLCAPGTRIANPLDAGDPPPDAVYAQMCRAALDDAGIDMLAWAMSLPGGEADPTHLQSVAAHSDKPLLAFNRMRYRYPPQALRFQEAAGFPFLQGIPELLSAASALAFYGERVGRAVPILPPAPQTPCANNRDGVLALLARHGVVKPRTLHVKTAAQAGAAALKIGLPVALKIVSADVTHKSDVGGVLVGLATADMVERGAEEMAAQFARRAPGARLDGFEVQEMVSGVEVLIGVREDEQMGPLLAIGAGGVLVDLIQDVAIELLPVDRTTTRAMLDRLKIARILAGVRGRAAADVDALVSAAEALVHTYLACRPVIKECEINPLIVLAKGEGVRAVDVRMKLREATPA